MVYYRQINNKLVEYTAEETAARDAEIKAWNDASADRKLVQIKKIRKQKLEDTDWMANSDVTMPSYIKTWRQTLRDIPANHTNESAYDLLLERDLSTKLLKHSIWKQPTE
tara:strand:- start:58 stop:387 length:330 start_codon:yes stop_codon:yes gene_type:complete